MPQVHWTDIGHGEIGGVSTVPGRLPQLPSRALVVLAIASLTISPSLACNAAQWPTAASRQATAIGASTPELPSTRWLHDLGGLSAKVGATKNEAVVATAKQILAFDPVTGRQNWSIAPDQGITVNKQLPNGIVQTTVTTPLFCGTLVVVGVSDLTVGKIVALDAGSGRVVWQYVSRRETAGSSGGAIQSFTDGPIMNQPVIWRDRIVARTGSGLTAVRVSDGARLWSVRFGDQNLPFIAASGTPVVTRSAIIFNSDAGAAIAIDPLTGSPVWNTGTLNLVSSGSQTMRRLRVSFSDCDPAFGFDSAFVGDGDGNVYRIDASTGKVVWATQLSYTHQLTVQGSRLFAATERGFYEINPVTGKLWHTYPVFGGVRSFLIAGNCAFLEHNAQKNTGWEGIDINRFSCVWTDRGFTPTAKPVEVGASIFCVGSPGPVGAARAHLQLRMYALN
jgi:hypothetical protein